MLKFFVIIFLVAFSSYALHANFQIKVTSEDFYKVRKINDEFMISLEVHSGKIINGLSIILEFDPECIQLIPQGKSYVEDCRLLKSNPVNAQYVLMSHLNDSGILNISTVILGGNISGISTAGKLVNIYFKLLQPKPSVIKIRKVLTNVTKKSKALNNDKSPTSIQEETISDIYIDYNVSLNSLFVAGYSPPTDFTELKVYPNPFIPYDGDDNTGKEYDGSPNSGIIFDSCTADAVLEIFTLQGIRVKAIPILTNPYRRIWDGTNSSNQKVASGLYLYIIRDYKGNKKTGKIVIIR